MKTDEKKKLAKILDGNTASATSINKQALGLHHSTNVANSINAGKLPLVPFESSIDSVSKRPSTVGLMEYTGKRRAGLRALPH